MTITFPSDTKDVIDSIRSAIGREVTFYTYTLSGCSVCSLDPITNTSVDSFCTTCSGSYWIKTLVGTNVNAHITWGNSEQLNWVSAGQFINGDCRVQIEYTNTNLTLVNQSDYVEVDGRKFSINDRIYRGVPEINRILLDLKENETPQ